MCSEHFVNAKGRLLRPNEVPLLKLPTNSYIMKKRKPPKERHFAGNSVCDTSTTEETLSPGDCSYSSVGTQTERMYTSNEVSDLLQEITSLKEEVAALKEELNNQSFQLENVKDDDSKMLFYTGFQSYRAFESFFHFVGPAVNMLRYSDKSSDDPVKKGRPRILNPSEELFMTLIRLRLGLMEQDIAFRFVVSQSTVSRIVITWTNFLFLELKKIPLWPPKEVITGNMPKQFKEKYPSTRVVIDATEVYIDQPKLPELQQMTFSSYKNVIHIKH